MNTDTTPDQLDALRETKPSTILIDYRGTAGPNKLPHTAPRVMHASGKDPLVLMPGLNVRQVAMWSSYKDHPPMAELIDKREVSEVDLEQLDAADLTDLAERTVDGDAIKMLHDRESGKLLTAGRRHRQDPELLALLDRKLARAKKRRPLNMAGIAAEAATQSTVLSQGARA